MVKNAIVGKKNSLVEARYSLNLNEQKIILYSVSKQDYLKQPNFNTVEFSVEEFTELIGTTKERHTEIKKTIKNLMKKPIEIKTEYGYLIANWVSSLKYIEKEGKIILRFDEDLKPYLLQLKGTYTQYKLKNVIHFKNKYSIRIYELLKQVEGMYPRQRTIPLQELREILGIQKTQYELFSNFDKFVIKPPKKELLKYSDICFEYEKIKDGKNIVAIKFIIEKNHSNIDKEEQAAEDIKQFKENGVMDLDEIKRMTGLTDYKFSDKQVLELYEIVIEYLNNSDKCPYEYIRYYIAEMRKEKKVVRPYGWLKKALKNDYEKFKYQVKMQVKTKELQRGFYVAEGE